MKITFFLTLIFGLLLSSAGLSAIANKADGEYVTLSGKVTEVSADAFMLKTKDKTIIVEMDDSDWDADGYKLVKGDEVVVNGRVDRDFLERNKVEAGSVYVKNLNTYFYASSADEEGAPYLPNIYPYVETLPDNAIVDLQGKVVSVNGRTFVLDTGLRKVTVDTNKLIYNPMDDVGFTKIDKGDRVRVSGVVDDDFFAGKTINTNSIVELR